MVEGISVPLSVPTPIDVVFLEALRASFPDRQLRSTALELTRLTGAIYGLLPPAKDEVGLSGAVAQLVMNFIRLRAMDSRWLLIVSLRPSEYTGAKVSYRSMRKALEGMVAAGLISVAAKGFLDRTTGKKYRTRYKATDALFRLVAEHGVTPFMIDRPDGPLVVMRDKDPKGQDGQVDGGHWPKARMSEKRVLEREVKEINTALRAHFVGLYVPDSELEAIHDRLIHRREELRCIDFFHKSLRRVFNDSNPERGGRFYGGWWQNVPRNYRTLIRIADRDGQPQMTREQDYSSIQPQMLYALLGVPAPPDAYSVYPDVATNKASRGTAKMLLLQMLNATDRRDVLGAAREEIINEARTLVPPGTPVTVEASLPAGCPPLEELLARIEQFHEPIRHHFYNDTGKGLSYLDSQLAATVMSRLIKEHGAVALPIHDSFIVQRQHNETLKQYMHDAFEAKFGTPIRIKAKVAEYAGHADNGAYGDPPASEIALDRGALPGYEVLLEKHVSAKYRAKYSVYYKSLDMWRIRHPQTNQQRSPEQHAAK